MARPTARTLDRDGIDAFLESQSTGTLSLARGNESYAIPVAFTYSPETGNFHFRLGYGPDSRKREYIDATERATFVVAAETEAGWKSVVADGSLTHRSAVDSLDSAPAGDATKSQVQHELEIPFYQVFDAPGDMRFTLVRLETDGLSGVIEAEG